MKIYIIGDIHGEHEKFKLCLESVNFDYESDRLIQLGDIVDRGLKSYEVVEELLKIKDLIAIRGNHDATFYESIRTGSNNVLFSQGGRETLESYIRSCNPDKSWAYKLSSGDNYSTNFEYDDYPLTHREFFKNQLPYYIDKNNNLFIHGGFNRHRFIEQEENMSVFYWDRDLLHSARSYSTTNSSNDSFKTKNNFKEIFIGHTPTTYFDSKLPLKQMNIWNLDTGCGKGGLLTIMNLETKEFKQF